MIISHNISKNNLNNIYDKIINPLKGDNIDVDIATCISGDHNIISNDVTYNFKFDGFQLAKVCYVVNNFNDEYEYYIKIRTEIILKTSSFVKYYRLFTKTSVCARGGSRTPISCSEDSYFIH